MSTILLVTSSPRGDESLSTKVAIDLVDTLRTKRGNATVIHRDVGTRPIPHLDRVTIEAMRKPAATCNAEEAAAIEYSDRLVAELLAADIVVIATGIINFGISSTLKTWIDHVARAGLTFRYTEDGPVGLVTGKKVYLVVASGGIYSEGAAQAMNHAVPYLKTVLGFMGMTDVDVIYVEGVALGPEAAQKAIASALARAKELARAA